MINQWYRVGILALVVFVMASCSKDEEPADVTLQFNHFFKETAFRADTVTVYTLDNGEELHYQRLEYYVTNIQLKAEDGSWWSEENSYHIINASEHNPSIVLEDLPYGTYTELRYMMGVDSVRNFSGAQDGALSPSRGLFWSWNTGYIFLAAEGRCSSCPENNPFFIHHIGGFRSPYEANHVITHELPSNLVLDDGSNASIDLRVNVNEIHEGEAIQINFAETQAIHASSETTKLMSENYAKMINVTGVTN